jgi:hypothetical protein
VTKENLVIPLFFFFTLAIFLFLTLFSFRFFVEVFFALAFLFFP